MADTSARHGKDTRLALLQAALKCFAQKGYAGTSIRDIVTTAAVSRPVLYYHFDCKATLYRALVGWAAEERLRLMREAVARANSLPEQLKELCVAMFEFAHTHRELVRLAFSTALAAPGEVPREAQCFEQGWKSFEFLQALLEQAREAGVLDQRFDSQTLAMGFGGLMHLHVMLHLVRPEQPLDRATAERVVDLFLRGAASDTARPATPTSPGAQEPQASP